MIGCTINVQIFWRNKIVEVLKFKELYYFKLSSWALYFLSKSHRVRSML